MYRRGPSKSTPASVQCQKCLKRARHYSYECKATTQERPYIARPSRTQQLLNPKLVPKLASDSTDAQPDTKGLADEVLAKRETERARKRESEQDDDSDNDVSKRPRSASYNSAATMSTRGSLSPAGRRVSASPERPNRAIRSPSLVRRSPRRRSFDSGSDDEGRYSPSPKRYTRGTKSPASSRPRTRSSSRDDSPRRGRFDQGARPADYRNVDRRRRRYSESPSQSPQPESRRRFRSRSPRGPWRRDRTPPRHNERPADSHYRNDRNGRGQVGGPRERDARQRSLSPFSKRLALTQAMNADR